VFKWLKRLLFGAQAAPNPALPDRRDSAQPHDLGGLNAYVEQRKREIFDDYQKRLADGTLKLAPSDGTQVDPRDELERAHLLMLQAQELLAVGNAKGAIAVIEEANRINKKYAQQ
jgi:hypothetical protein